MKEIWHHWPGAGAGLLSHFRQGLRRRRTEVLAQAAGRSRAPSAWEAPTPSGCTGAPNRQPSGRHRLLRRKNRLFHQRKSTWAERKWSKSFAVGVSDQLKPGEVAACVTNKVTSRIICQWAWAKPAMISLFHIGCFRWTRGSSPFLYHASLRQWSFVPLTLSK